MPYVLKLMGWANGMATEHDGQYLKDFDFEAHGGIGEISMTPNADDAKRFPGAGEALMFTRTVPKCRPLRDDLLPNRPLTASNWLAEPLSQPATTKE